jgi:hypothetical protein
VVRVEPLHEPPHCPLPVHGVREPCGGSVIFVQTPSEPETSQASHWPAQAWSQQKPSVHDPDVHSLPALHAAPLLLSWHIPPVHLPPGAQSVSAVHVVLHAALAVSHL